MRIVQRALSLRSVFTSLAGTVHVYTICSLQNKCIWCTSATQQYSLPCITTNASYQAQAWHQLSIISLYHLDVMTVYLHRQRACNIWAAAWNSAQLLTCTPAQARKRRVLLHIRALVSSSPNPAVVTCGMFRREHTSFAAAVL